MIISLIAAVAENGVIGSNGDIPWRIKSDFRYFKEMTTGKPVIMGRKTFEGLPGGPLKNRPNIVISRDPAYSPNGGTAARSFEEAIDLARATNTGSDEIMIAGGAEIYRLALPMADRLYINKIHVRPEGDTFFPPFDRDDWIETRKEHHAAGPDETADYTITILVRKNKSA